MPVTPAIVVDALIGWSDRRGNPHALVCTRNQARFGRRVAKRQKDLGQQMRLRQSSGQ
ncbi:hypothetical protein [Accumulibacter sp.]|uniref:hypothetical protein n=1 Tax=Accumulibacter sp. TaxID=2053492 RepID=UPI0015986572|nr:hypothetical protein [Accumulibacter sp.]QKS30348.1 MAG: hypothetical protein HT579_16355 [Candidatus Accumulibacter similis]